MTSASDHPTNESDETFALIRFEDTGPPIATFHNLRQDSQLLSGVHGYAYTRDISAAQSRIEWHVSRAVSRLSCFSKQTIRRPRTSSDTRKRDGSSVASVHVRVRCVRFSVHCGKKQMHDQHLSKAISTVLQRALSIIPCPRS
jgi:hypothetical protein